MTLWVDKYRPKDFDSLDHHQKQAQDLKSLTKEGDFPHLLFYGPSGSGKKTRVSCLLRELYGPGTERLKMETISMKTPSNKKIEIVTINSCYHTEVNPSDVGIQDRVVVMDIIKTVAQSYQYNANAQREFKVIVLTDVDDLTKDAQHALRRTMEKYIENCRLILCATSISRVIPAVKSRCLCVRVPAPSEEIIADVLQKTCKREDLFLSPALAKRIAAASDRNLRRALLMVQAMKVKQYPFKDDQEIPKPDWQKFMATAAQKALQRQNIETLAELREYLYELIINGIPSRVIFKTLLKELLKKCDVGIREAVVEEAAIHEFRMARGNKAIFHLESFLANFMKIYLDMLTGFLAEDF